MRPIEIRWVRKLRQILNENTTTEEKLKKIYLYGVEEEWKLGKRWEQNAKNAEANQKSLRKKE